MCGVRLFRLVNPDFTSRTEHGRDCAQQTNVISRVYFDERNYSFFLDNQSLR